MAAPKGRNAWKRLSRRPLRRSTTLSMVFTGGAEGWVRVESRGHVGAFPGYWPILDVLRAVCNDMEGVE